MVDIKNLPFGVVGHNGGGVAREAENLFGFGPAGVERGGAD